MKRCYPFLIIVSLIFVSGSVLASGSPSESLENMDGAVNPNGLSYVPDAVLISDDETVYLLSRANLSVFRWSVPQRAYTETISLDAAPNLMTYSGKTNRLYLGYTDKVMQVKLSESLGVQPYISTSSILHGLSTADEYVFVCRRSGSVGFYETYALDGTLVSQKVGRYSDEYTWSAANRRMYHLDTGGSPRSLHWIYIDESGLFGNSRGEWDFSYTVQNPTRIAPDGSVVVLGSGRIYDAITLVHTHTLSITISDAMWIGDNLFTLRAFEGASQVQKWGVDYSIQAALKLEGTPIRVFTVSEGLLVITHFLGKPWFWILDPNLNVVYQTPLHCVFLPSVYRNYCTSPILDDFSNPTSGWPITETAYWSYGYLNGEYRMYAKRAQAFGAVSRSEYRQDGSLIMEVDVRQSSSVNGSLGIVYGLNDDWSQFYTFEIYPATQEYAVFRFSAGAWSLVTYGSSNAIRPGQSANRLRLVMRPLTFLYLYVNGAFLVSPESYNPFAGYRVGLTATSDAAGFDARFDNYKLVPEGCPENLVAANRALSGSFEALRELEWDR